MARILALFLWCATGALALTLAPTRRQAPAIRATTTVARAAYRETATELELAPSAPQSQSRRASLQRLARTVLVAAPLVALAPSALADDGAVADVAAPSAAEAEADESARLARKLAAQKKAGAGSDKKNFAQSLSNEQERQKEVKSMTKEERRAEMCEMLGRGC